MKLIRYLIVNENTYYRRLWFCWIKYCLFLKERLKNVEICSLDTLIRKGSETNKNRLKKIKVKNYKIDITNNYKVQKLKKFNLVIDCCAEPAIEASKKDPDRVFNTNLIGTFNILKNV